MNNVGLGAALAVIGIFTVLIVNYMAGVTSPSYEDMNAGVLTGMILFGLGAIETIGGPITWAYNKYIKKEN